MTCIQKSVSFGYICEERLALHRGQKKVAFSLKIHQQLGCGCSYRTCPHKTKKISKELQKSEKSSFFFCYTLYCKLYRCIVHQIRFKTELIAVKILRPAVHLSYFAGILRMFSRYTLRISFKFCVWFKTGYSLFVFHILRVFS